MNKRFDIWYRMVNDAIWWENICADHAWALYENTRRAYTHNSSYYFQGVGESVNLTKLYEQYKMLEALTARVEDIS